MGTCFGTFLKKPITTKESSDETNGKLNVGLSAMQGWRTSQEDAHNCILDYDTDTHFFAVYDGHGGHEVAEYCAEKLPDYILNTEEYKQGKFKEALTKAFLELDATIKLPEVKELLKKKASERRKDDDYDHDSDDSAASEDENIIKDLHEEATMPIEQVIEKYKNEGATQSENIKKSSISEEGTSCSSSSAEPCSSSSNSRLKQCENGVSNSNEAGTSDTTCQSTELPQPSSSTSNIVPDSSDIKEAKAAEKTDVESTENNEVSTEEQDKDDIKTIENGAVSKKGKQKARITPQRVKSPPNTRPKPDDQQLYKKLLELGYFSDSEDSSDDNDQSFEAPNEESSEDEGEGVNVAIEVDDSDESLGADEKAGNEDDESLGADEKAGNEDDDDTDDENENDYTKLHKYGPGGQSGCTAIVALLREKTLYVANAGDCRCVVSRAGKAVAMSFDHKPYGSKEKKRIEKAGGEICSEGRIDGGLNLSRAIGDYSYKLRQDLSEREQMIIALPDIRSLTLTSDDEFMVIACDGIWNSMNNQKVVDFVGPRLKEGKQKLSEICEEMFDQCLAPDTALHVYGCDNMTAIIVKFDVLKPRRTSSPHEDAESRSKKIKTEDNESESQIHTTTL